MKNTKFWNQPKWRIDLQQGDIFHCHHPRFCARIVWPNEHLLREYHKLETGEMLVELTWSDPKPCQSELTQLMAEAQKMIHDHSFTLSVKNTSNSLLH